MRTTLRLSLLVAIVALVAACSSGAGAAPVPAETLTAPVAAETTAPDPTPESTIKNVTATLAPREMTDGQGDEVVAGVVTDVVQSKLETDTQVDGYREVRGGEIVSTHTSNDVRADGTVKVAFNIDFFGNGGPLWGTMSIVNDGGTWSGPCTGASIAAGQLGPMSCWLAGSGTYEGWTYYQSSRTNTDGFAAVTLGVIYEGEAPAR